MIIAVDFDGTCVTHEFPRVGKDIGAIPVLKALVAQGHELILLTVRNRTQNEFGDTLEKAIQWFRDNKIPLYGVNENPRYRVVDFHHKVYAAMYIDDAALGIPLKFDPKWSSRQFVDWKEVRVMLEKLKMINPIMIVGTTSSKDNLCDYCKFSQPECKPEQMEFGDGLGHDNVIECSEFEVRDYPNSYPIILKK